MNGYSLSSRAKVTTGTAILHSAGVPVNIVETLTGHSAGNVHEHKELISLKTLQEGLECLQYPIVLQALNHSQKEEVAA